jgi:redox-sensitive bicupin YhaK (pirin superfamily)
MQSWDLRTHDVQPHQPQILNSDLGESRSILINLPAGEQLQDHEVHERAHLVVVDGEVDIDGGGTTLPATVGTLAVFDPHERHEVRARTDARLLLVLAPWPGPGHPGVRDDD